MHWLETRIPPPAVMLLTGLAMFAAAPGDMASGIAWPLRAAVAAALTLAALWFGPRAVGAFRRARTTISPLRVERASALITSGSYARSRNPMYLAMALVLAAWAAWLGHLAPMLGPLGFALFLTRFQIIPEERALAARFGKSYGVYKRSVRRWL